jgi:hypothetical protein
MAPRMYVVYRPYNTDGVNVGLLEEGRAVASNRHTAAATVALEGHKKGDGGGTGEYVVFPEKDLELIPVRIEEAPRAVVSRPKRTRKKAAAAAAPAES